MGLIVLTAKDRPSRIKLARIADEGSKAGRWIRWIVQACRLARKVAPDHITEPPFFGG